MVWIEGNRSLRHGGSERRRRSGEELTVLNLLDVEVIDGSSNGVDGSDSGVRIRRGSGGGIDIDVVIRESLVHIGWNE